MPPNTLLPHAPLPPVPLVITRLSVGVVSVLVGLGALALLGCAALMGDQPYWLLVLLESCTVIAGVVGVLFLKGRFREGPAMTVLCIAVTFAVTAFLAWLSVRTGLQLRGRNISLKTWMFARVGVAGILVCFAVWEVLRRDARSITQLTRALWYATGLAGTLAILFALSGAGGAVPTWIVWTLLAAGSVVALWLFCAAVHSAVRAFEFGKVRAERSSIGSGNG